VKAKKKFSRKSSGRFAVRINLKWKSKNGKWISRSLVQVSDTLESAIALLIQHEEINSLTYEVKNENFGSKKKKIHSATKRIVGVSYDKYVGRKRKIS
jgi:hypothetical protein